MKFIKSTKLIALALVGLIGISTLSPASAFAADSTSNICSSSASAEVKKAAGCSGSTDGLKVVVKNILSAIIAVLGIVAAIFVVVGGVQYMTSSGDPSKVEKGKKTVLYALIGLIIAALAFVIVQFAIDTIANAPETETPES